MARIRQLSKLNRITKRTGATAVRQKRKTTNITQSAEKHFRLLDLPPELRNLIYLHVAQSEDTAQICKRQPRHLIGGSPIALANKQIREEYMSALCLNAPTISTTVQDFDFRHVVTFFNHLSGLELKALTDGGASSNQREMVIRLTFSRQCPFHPHDLYLDRWLNRYMHPTKKGAKINVTYSVDSASFKDWQDRNTFVTTWRDITWGMDPSAKKTELYKIVAGMKKAASGWPRFRSDSVDNWYRDRFRFGG